MLYPSFFMPGSLLGQRSTGSVGKASASLRALPRASTSQHAPTPANAHALTTLAPPARTRSRKDALAAQRASALRSSIRLFSASNACANVPKDPYGTLGVKKDASTKDIKAAYYQVRRHAH